ncbi:MAG: 50S ribosomal protein L10 [Candidatus Pacearchaeota archaeon]|nr:50S ribosomal protein L10 [Candidatus Pacearchaeota archaeon]
MAIKKLSEKQIERKVPEKKQKLLKKLVDLSKQNRTIMIASIEGLPSAQFQKIKKSLKGKATVIVSKKKVAIKAMDEAKLTNLNKKIEKNVVIIFSQLEPFELSSLLSELKIKSKMKAGQIVEKDILIEPCTTDIMAGPAITEFSNANIKVGIDQGKIAIKESHLIPAGSKISGELTIVLDRLEIKPVSISIKPLIAHDSKEDKDYENPVIDKEETLNRLKQASTEALNLAYNTDFPCKEIIGLILGKAATHALALNQILNQNIQ